MDEVENRPTVERTRSFGYWLKRRRKALDLTQQEVARSVSCSPSAIRKIEADERRPSRRLAERLAERLAVPAEERAAFIEVARAALSVGRLEVDRAPWAAPGPAAPEAASAAPLVAQPDGSSGGPPGASLGEAMPFVGRNAEYRGLVDLLAALETGTGSAALIEGEPGIGKSRLMHELAAYARSKGMRTLGTRCYEIEASMPYQPVTDLVIQALNAAPRSALEQIAPVALAELAALVPVVAQRVVVPALASDFPEARQVRLFAAICELFDLLGRGSELVVSVDDLQWADAASTQFLHYLARRAAGRPQLVLLAYRDDEIASDARLAALVDSLGREQHVRCIALQRLRLEETRAMLENDAALAERLQRETDGNPFFLTSMLHALRDGSIAGDETGPLRLPDALRASVRARLAHVPPEARRVLDVAAVQGRGVDFETLTALTGAAPASVSNGLEMLVGRRLLSETADGVYDFSHDKLREVAYLEIGGARRLLLHRALAETLEGQGADNMSPEHSARLAEHYERGHAWPEALEQMVAAAERSERLFALRDALRWLDRAVALVQVHPDAARRVGLVELYDRRGSVRAQIGETAGAVADIRRVIEAANASRDHAKARDALIRLGMTYRRGDDYAEAIACLAAALEECRANGDERGAADTFYHLGTVAWSDGRNREAIAYHAQAVAICERLGLADLVAVQAYHGRGEAHFSNLEPRAAIACYERSIELARGIGEKSYESENLMMVGYAWTGSMGLGDYVTAAAKFEAALEIAQRADLQWHIGPTLLGGDHVRACTGRYGEAYEGMIRTLDWLESSGQIRYQLMAFDFLAQLLLDAGLNAEAAACAERALALSQRSNVTFWRPRLAADRAIARLRLGDLDAGPELERDLARCRGQNELYQMTRCLEACAELALARGDARGCLAFAAELRDCADAAGLVELSGSAHRWLGEALIRLGDSGAVAELALAARAAREVGRVRLAYDVDRARATLGDENEAERWSTLIRESLAGSPLADARARGARP